MDVNSPKLFFDNIKYNLEVIKYKGLNQQNDGQDVHIETFDEYKLVTLNSKALLLHVSRYIEFNPKSIFNLELIASLYLPLNQSDKKFDGTLDEMEKYVHCHIEQIINNSSVMESVSLIISQISSAYGKVPIITPPFFTPKNQVNQII